MAMTPTTTIRVSRLTRDRLNALSASLGRPASEVVAELVDAADESRLLEEATKAFAAMSPQRLADYRGEAEETGSGFGDPAPSW